MSDQLLRTDSLTITFGSTVNFNGFQPTIEWPKTGPVSLAGLYKVHNDIKEELKLRMHDCLRFLLKRAANKISKLIFDTERPSLTQEDDKNWINNHQTYSAYTANIISKYYG